MGPGQNIGIAMSAQNLSLLSCKGPKTSPLTRATIIMAETSDREFYRDNHISAQQNSNFRIIFFGSVAIEPQRKSEIYAVKLHKQNCTVVTVIHYNTTLILHAIK